MTLYQRNRDVLYDTLTTSGYEVYKPQGSFYMFPRSPIEDDLAFSRELMEKLVLVTPGSGFGTPGYFRIAYCVTSAVVDASLSTFVELGEKYGLDPEVVKASIEKAAAQAEAEKHKPLIDVTKNRIKVTADWSDCENFKKSDKGNYILASAYWIKTNVKGPHGGKITVNMTVVESAKTE